LKATERLNELITTKTQLIFLNYVHQATK